VCSPLLASFGRSLGSKQVNSCRTNLMKVLSQNIIWILSFLGFVIFRKLTIIEINFFHTFFPLFSSCCFFVPAAIPPSNMNLDQKVLVVSHFLMQGNLLLINVYATLWMGVTLQHSNLRYNVASNKVRDYLFDLGISWGALILCCASFLFYLSSRVQQAISQSLKT